ncbi:hypothetical protein MBELCI_2632 [Limimaricola cinnabarinus LL-001]|uniref:Uncharacterized protein n=1 Tax=Limimaricola cinnabarinus LL-001 TaxID=1337093 RepID=U2Z575_9RHOB|nr:hypothetical protein MBELCI_2632 [Limimaricola cinnabarinus LL-001]
MMSEAALTMPTDDMQPVLDKARCQADLGAVGQESPQPA